MVSLRVSLFTDKFASTSLPCQDDLYVVSFAGITLLVTNVERRQLDSMWEDLLWKRFIEENGQRTVRVNSTELPVHPDFRLYFSTSVPLFQKGT